MYKEQQSPLQQAAEDLAREFTDTLSLGIQSLCKTAYLAGANWQRNHVWHEVSEKPNMKDYKGRDKHILVEHLDGTVALTWPILLDKKGVYRWAYLTDILPDGEEYEKTY